MLVTCRYQLLRARPEDTRFLFRLFSQTFGQQFSGAGLPAEMVEMLLRQQFDIKQAAYQNAFPDAEYSIIQFHGRSAGQLRLNKLDNEIHIVDISVLPAQQRKGLASSVIQDVLMSDDRDNRNVSLSVERGSPAQSLYQKLGFEIVEETEIYNRMINDV